MADLQQARAAKARLRTELARTRGLKGIGLTPDGAGYALQVNIDHTPDGEIPASVDGVPVRVRVVGALTVR